MDFNLTEEHLMVRDAARDFAQTELLPGVIERDEKQQFPKELVRKMGELGVLGITADPKYGGAGMGAVAATIVMEEFGKACASSTLSYLAHSILCVNNIQNNANNSSNHDLLKGKNIFINYVNIFLLKGKQKINLLHDSICNTNTTRYERTILFK